jgi:hypothetical protein
MIVQERMLKLIYAINLLCSAESVTDPRGGVC